MYRVFLEMLSHLKIVEMVIFGCCFFYITFALLDTMNMFTNMIIMDVMAIIPAMYVIAILALMATMTVM